MLPKSMTRFVRIEEGERRNERKTKNLKKNVCNHLPGLILPPTSEEVKVGKKRFCDSALSSSVR